jgi:hypothetical protein
VIRSHLAPVKAAHAALPRLQIVAPSHVQRYQCNFLTVLLTIC